jgi:hypothetical protein
MRRKTIITLVIGLVISIGAFSIWSAGATTTIGPGYDLFNTPDNGASGESLSLPAGFFVNSAGKPSLAFNGGVAFKGGEAVPGYYADTVIERTQSVDVPGATPLLVAGLRMVSVAPIKIGFTDGSQADYSVSVKESPSVASTGSLHFNADNTFNSSLQINREYTFTSPGQPDKVFDSAIGGWPAISLTAGGTWQPSTSAISAPATGGVAIVPNTHQAIIAAHATRRAIRPKAEATPIDATPISDKSGDDK